MKLIIITFTMLLVSLVFIGCTNSIDQNNLNKANDICLKHEGTFEIKLSFKNTDTVYVNCKDGYKTRFQKFDLKDN